jgi:hypothetical protein
MCLFETHNYTFVCFTLYFLVVCHHSTFKGHKCGDATMRYDDLHHQDVRAAVRKRYGSIVAFEQAKGLPKGSVHDLLRGRGGVRAKAEIEHLLTEQANTRSRRRAQPKSERAAA